MVKLVFKSLSRIVFNNVNWSATSSNSKGILKASVMA